RGDRPAPPRRPQPRRDRRPPRPHRAVDPRPAPPRARRSAQRAGRDAVRTHRRRKGGCLMSVLGAPTPTVPVTRLDQADPVLLEELLEVVGRVARAGAFTMGHELEAFEAEFASYNGIAHAVGVSSGTEAISLALRALGIGAGDEVIVPANSFIATAEAVSWIGATVKPVDVDPETHLIT